MGPRLFSRGELNRFIDSTLRKESFNGAAAFQPRRGKLPVIVTGMLALHASMGPRLFSRGEIGEGWYWSQGIEASMGPRLFSRGEFMLAAAPAHADTLQWGRGFSAAERRTRRRGCATTASFNGAAAFQPRRDRGVRLDRRPRRASMGPRLFSRGEGRAGSIRRKRIGASMGPRLFSRGEFKSPKKYVKAPEASMGPRLFSRGETHGDATVSELREALQWGRGFSAAERIELMDDLRRTYALQWGRGFSAAESVFSIRTVYGHTRASMGPRLFSRGESSGAHTHTLRI